jgi:hypothetical protein
LIVDERTSRIEPTSNFCCDERETPGAVLTVLSIARSEGEEVDISADLWTCAVCDGTPLAILVVVLGAKAKGVVKGVELQE